MRRLVWGMMTCPMRGVRLAQSFLSGRCEIRHWSQGPHRL